MLFSTRIRRWLWVLGIGLFLGSICGLVLREIFYLPEAATVLTINDSAGDIAYGEREAATVTVMRAVTPEFLTNIADRLHSPRLVKTLSSKQYGGLGNLSLRISPDGGALEVRVKDTDPELALRATQSVADLIVELQRADLRID